MRIRHDMPWDVNRSEYLDTKTGTTHYYYDRRNILMVGPPLVLNKERCAQRGKHRINKGYMKEYQMQFYVEVEI